MTRREEIVSELGLNEIVQESIKRHPRFADKRVGFIDGAEWMQEKMIEKACECIIKLHNWPTQYEEYAKLQEEFIKEFRKAMEE